MKEKERRPSFLTWKAASIVLASAGAGYILGSEKARLRVGKELRRCYRGLKNEIKRVQDKRRAAEFGLKAEKVLIQVFPEGLRVKK